MDKVKQTTARRRVDRPTKHVVGNEQARAARQRQARADGESPAYRQDVANIVTILGRDVAPIEEIEEAIRILDGLNNKLDGLNNKTDRVWPPKPFNTADKKIAQSLGKAVGTLEYVLHPPGEAAGQVRARRGVISRALHGEHREFSEWEKQLKHWRERFEAFGGKDPDYPDGDRGTLFEKTGPNTWPLGKPKPSTPDMVHRRNAAKAAAALFDRLGLKPSATAKSEARNRQASKFCRVAAVFYGDKNADLSTQCRAIVKARKTRNQVSS